MNRKSWAILTITILLFYTFVSLNANAQILNQADSIVVVKFLNDLEIAGCPPIIHPTKPLKQWYGLTYKEHNGRITELGIEFDLIYKSISCTNIPASIKELSQVASLRSLSLKNLGIENLPTSIGELTQLTTLDFSYNKLAVLPVEFTNLTTLQSLNLSHNSFTEFSPRVSALTQLKFINLSYNKITGTIPTTMWPKGTNNNVFLDFSNNHLSGSVSMPDKVSLIADLRINNNHFTFNDLYILESSWPRDQGGHYVGLSMGNQSINGKTLSPAVGATVELKIENYTPEGQVLGWFKYTPSGESNKVSPTSPYIITSFDPEVDKGNYYLGIRKGKAILKYGPVTLKGNTHAPSLSASTTAINLRPRRIIPPVSIFFEDDFSLYDELQVEIENIPQHLNIISSSELPGQYKLNITTKEDGWIGQESFVVKVTDEDNLTTVTTITVSIQAAFNQSPSIQKIPDVFTYTDSVVTGSTVQYNPFISIPMHYYVKDDYDAVEDLKSSIHQDDIDRLEAKGLYIVYTDGSIFIYSPDMLEVKPLFNETIRFTVADLDGGISNGALQIKAVVPLNNVPKITFIADRYLIKNSSLPVVVNIDDYLTDDYNLKADLHINLNTDALKHFNASLTGHMLTLTPKTTIVDVFDTLKITVSEPNEYMLSDISIRIKQQTDSSPLISGIADQTIVIGDTFKSINLLESVYDDTTLPASIGWTFHDLHNLQATVVNHTLTISPINKDWKGVETIRFTATDAEGNVNEKVVSFTIEDVFNNAPVVKLKDQRKLAGAPFDSIDLLTVVEDDNTLPEEITWSIDNSEAPDLNVNRQDNVLNIAPKVANWRGRNYVNMMATDKMGKSSNNYHVEFSRGFAAPLVQNIPEQIRPAGTPSIFIDLNEYITDDFTPINQLGIHILNPDSPLQPHVDYYEPLGLITLSVMSPTNWSGSELIKLKVIDTDLLETSFEIKFTIIEQSYSISGVVKDITGQPLAGVIINDFSNQVITDGNGQYAARELNKSTLTITPSLIGYSFRPSEINVIQLSNDLTNQDFTAQPVITTYTVSGNITDTDGIGLAGVKLQGFSQEIVTNEKGDYQTEEVSTWTGIITPVLDGYAFNPDWVEIDNLSANISENFIGVKKKFYTISGNIVDEMGAPLVNVVIDGLPLATRTDQAGKYRATVPFNWAGTIKPSLQQYIFTPEKIEIFKVEDDLYGKDFSAGLITGLASDAFTFSIYPNPTKYICIITLPSKMETSLYVHSITGVLIASETWQHPPQQKELFFPTKGVYIITLKYGTSQHMEKVVVH